jgi:hypothetical protein
MESIEARPVSEIVRVGTMVFETFEPSTEYVADRSLAVTVKVSALPTITDIADAVSTLLLKLTKSVGDNKAEIDAVSTTDGVQVQVATPLEVATDEHPVRFVPAFLKATFPGVLAATERVTGVP